VAVYPDGGKRRTRTQCGPPWRTAPCLSGARCASPRNERLARSLLATPRNLREPEKRPSPGVERLSPRYSVP